MSDSHTEIILRHGGAELARVTLPPGEYVIGRSPEVAIFAETPLLSRRHAQLIIEDDQLLLQDLGSSNGTFVNEQPVTESTRLLPHQSVRLGDVELQVHRQYAPEEVPPEQPVWRVGDSLRSLLPEELLTEKRYAVGKQIAQGGMGAILDAQQNTTRRTVAMKVMLGADEEADVRRFIEEAQVTAQLDHPNIVPIYELGIDEQEQLFYTMKLVRGITLKKVLELLGQGIEATVKKYPLATLLTIFQKVCDAVAFAHAKGVIHRDLKPENVMLGDFGSVLVMDWGLAKILGQDAGSTDHSAMRSVVASARTVDGDTSRTLSGTIMGTPAHMSPEQARGEVDSLDARSDVYALGTILFEILHLRSTVTGHTVGEIVEKASRGVIEWDASAARRSTAKGKVAPPRAGGHLPGGRVPDSLLAVCRKALAPERDQRYASVENLQLDLTAYQSGFATSAEKAGVVKQLFLALKRNKIAAAGVVAVLVVGATLGTKAVLEGRRAEHEGQRAKQALLDLKKTAPDLLRLAVSDANLQNFAAAQKSVDAALALDPALGEAYWQRAWNLIGLEDFAGAAEAFRAAQKIDPAAASFVRNRMLTTLERMAAARTPEERYDSGLLSSLFGPLREIGAFGSAAVLMGKMRGNNQERMNFARQRLESVLGKENFGLSLTPTGYLEVRVKPGAGSSFENLRGIPFDMLDANFSRVANLEPLRGMRLAKLVVNNCPVTDLGPLEDMALHELNISSTQVNDLSPLAGAPLRIFHGSGGHYLNVEALQGAPLEIINLSGTPVSDLSPLAGAPLVDVNINGTRVSDLNFLAAAPIQFLQASGNSALRDITSLRGRPVVRANFSNTGITDLSPLRGESLKTLSIDYCRKITDFSPLLEMTQLERIGCLGLADALPVIRRHPSVKFISYQLPGDTTTPDRPVAEFWKLYDAQVGQK